jgi:hypothetical protein
MADYNVFEAALNQHFENCECVAFTLEGGRLAECEAPRLTPAFEWPCVLL